MADTNGSSADALQKRVNELERKLDKTLREKEDLEKDVERLCIQTKEPSLFGPGPGLFSIGNTAVLREQLTLAETELSKAQARLYVVVEERDSLRDQLADTKRFKEALDLSLKKQLEKSQQLEKELYFHQTQSTHSLADRDKAVWEVENLKRQYAELEQQCQAAGEAMAAEKASRQEAEQQLRSARDQIASLEEAAQEAAAVPGLRQELREAKDLICKLEEEHSEMQEQLRSAQVKLAELEPALSVAQERNALLESKLGATETALEQAQAAYHVDTEQLKSEIEALSESSGSANARAVAAEAGFTSASIQLETVRRETQKLLTDLADSTDKKLSEIRAEMKEVNERYYEARAQLEQASSQKVAALMRLSAEEQAHKETAEAAAELRRQLADIKNKAAKSPASGRKAVKKAESPREIAEQARDLGYVLESMRST